MQQYYKQLHEAAPPAAAARGVATISSCLLAEIWSGYNELTSSLQNCGVATASSHPVCTNVVAPQ